MLWLEVVQMGVGDVQAQVHQQPDLLTLRKRHLSIYHSLVICQFIVNLLDCRQHKGHRKRLCQMAKWQNDTNENRRQFSLQSSSRCASNAIMKDMKDFYSGITRKACRVAENIALRVNVVCQQFPSTIKKFLEKIGSIKGKVHDKKAFRFPLVKRKQ